MTYFIMASQLTQATEDQLWIEVTGTALLKLRVVIENIGLVDQITGHAIVRGTLATSEREPVDLQCVLRQSLGSRVITGSVRSFNIAVDGRVRWVAVVRGTGRYRPGPARVTIRASAYDATSGEDVATEVQRKLMLYRLQTEPQPPKTPEPPDDRKRDWPAFIPWLWPRF